MRLELKEGWAVRKLIPIKIKNYGSLIPGWCSKEGITHSKERKRENSAAVTKRITAINKEE